jgi:hypothetical protein
MNWNERGDVHQHFYWSVVFNPRLIVSDPFLIWTNACNSELEKGSKLENILKHLLLLYPIASGIGLLKNRYRIVHGVDISIKIKSLFEFSVTFNDKMGIDIGLFNSLITFKDFKMDHLNDENVLELPKYLDAEKEGIIGNCNRMLSTCFAFADRIMCSVENIHGFSRLIYNLIDMLVSLQNMNIFLKTCTQKQMLQWDANAFMSVTGNIKIGFQGSLHSSWKPQCILQGGI